MTPFEHLSVLISIILGLGLAHLLFSVHRLIQENDRVNVYWLSLLWTVLVFLGMIEWWWNSFNFRQQFQWNFFYFLFILMSPVSLYLAAALVLPEIEPGESYDLKNYYYRIHGWLFATLALGPALDGIRRVIQEVPLTNTGVWSNFAGAIFIGSLAVVRNEKYHITVTLLITCLFLFFIVSNALRLQ